MSNKKYNNEFKFSLTQEDLLLCEKIFNADNFNPFTRYFIDIRDILPQAITKLQRVLSKKSYDVEYDCGNEVYYDFLKYTQNIINSYPRKYQKGMKYNPISVKHEFEDKVIRGVECKIGFYINDNPIVERIFYVDGYNPIARYSVDLLYSVIDITDDIYEKIKNVDVNNMWDDYYLINNMGFTINQIRELSVNRRTSLLRNIK